MSNTVGICFESICLPGMPESQYNYLENSKKKHINFGGAWVGFHLYF